MERNDLVEQARQRAVETHATYDQYYGLALEVTDRLLVKKETMSTPDLVDLTLMLRTIEDTLDHLRKEIKARRELCSKIGAIQITKKAMTEGTTLQRVKAEFASGTAETSMQGILPKRGSQEYIMLARHLKIPEDVIASGTFTPDWKGMEKYLTTLQAQGKGMPPGLKATMLVPKMKVIKHRGVTIGEHLPNGNEDVEENDDNTDPAFK